MSTVLRLIQDNNNPDAQRDNNLMNWQTPVNNAGYTSAYINAIKDPNGASANHEITSIPSPFARIDLVKSAFKYVAEHGLQGKTIFHKMVSDSLDVGEILFKYENFKDRVKIVYWDAKKEITSLQNSENEGHRVLGRTLETYLVQDAHVYNFDKMDGIYLLVYTGELRGECILGATSPRTLFFSVANDLSSLREEFQFNTDYAFDDEYNPLCNRDIKYVEYLFALRNSYNSANHNLFATHFKELNEYLSQTLKSFTGDTYQKLKNITIDSFPDVLTLKHDGGTNNVQVIAGLNLCKMPSKMAVNKSSFFIRASRQLQDSKTPVVLPITTGNQYSGWILSDGNMWNTAHAAPYKDENPMQDRKLPQTNQNYPYLTIGDFLEDYIVRMTYALNKDAFFNPEYRIQNQCFLLPLKDEFFKYFTVEDLIGGRMLEFDTNQNGVNVEVRLHIPVERGTIDYSRVYYGSVKDSNFLKPDAAHNKGVIVDKNDYFGFALIPAIKFANVQEANYRFVLSSQKDDSNYEVKIYNSDFAVMDGVRKSVRNPSNEKFSQNQVFAIEGDNLGYVRISDSGVSGIVLPILKPVHTNEDSFKFSVDFGTTNTHIVYAIGDSKIMPLNIRKEDQQIQLLSGGLEEEVKEAIYEELCPDLVGEGHVSKFPMRSVLLCQKQIDWRVPHFALGEANYAFLYGKKIVPKHNAVKTNLKWNNEQGNSEMIRYYIESLFFVMRNKVLLNNSPLDRVKIYWTYPLSMAKYKLDLFRQVWQDAYVKFFGPKVSNLIAINESIAPYYYHIKRNRGVDKIVTIDIGGGTTDMVYVEGEVVKFSVSTRFAANALFDDSKPSGIVRQFLSEMKGALESNKKRTLRDVLSDLELQGNGADIASFLFSIKENQGCQNINSLDFSLILQRDNTQKITFMFFYCAIIYHLATIMKAKKYDPPSNIGFSGNGSKVIDALTTNTTLLERLTKKIFERVYDDDYPVDGLVIVKIPNPKEATSMGAIDAKEMQEVYKTVLLGTDDNTFVRSSMTYQDIENSRADYIAKVENEIKKFVDLVFSLNGGNISFHDDFGIDEKAMSIAWEKCHSRIQEKIAIKLRQKIEEVGLKGQVEDTLFFYAIPDMLITLEEAICDQVQTGEHN